MGEHYLEVKKRKEKEKRRKEREKWRKRKPELRRKLGQIVNFSGIIQEEDLLREISSRIYLTENYILLKGAYELYEHETEPTEKVLFIDGDGKKHYEEAKTRKMYNVAIHLININKVSVTGEGWFSSGNLILDTKQGRFFVELSGILKSEMKFRVKELKSTVKEYRKATEEMVMQEFTEALASVPPGEYTINQIANYIKYQDLDSLDNFLRTLQDKITDATYDPFDRVWSVKGNHSEPHSELITTSETRATRKFTLRNKDEIFCSICRKIIPEKDLVHCPGCHNPFHENHFAEAIKTLGECPLCHRTIIEEWEETEYRDIKKSSSEFQVSNQIVEKKTISPTTEERTERLVEIISILTGFPNAKIWKMINQKREELGFVELFPVNELEAGYQVAKDLDLDLSVYNV